MANVTYQDPAKSYKTYNWTVGNATITVRYEAGDQEVDGIQVREQLRALYGDPNG